MDDGSFNPWPTPEDVSLLFTSYAQNFEDVILARVFPGETGFYIDAGANDPVFHSVTKHFYDKGWSGVNIEPHRRFYRRLREERPRDINVNAGLSDREAVATFHEEPTGTGISSLTTLFADWNAGKTVEQRPIELTTLARICERYVDRPIDFLKVDVEGVERPACEGGDWAKWRPRVVLIEANWPETFDDWDAWFKDRDYHFALFDRINRYYVRSEDRDLIPALAMPYNSLDRAIPYQHSRLFRQLREELDDLKRRGSDRNSSKEVSDKGAGPIVRRVKRLARRFPRSASAMKQLLGRAG